MHLQQVVCFELAPGCPHAKEHPFCPASQDRWANLDTSEAMTDDRIVETAVALSERHEFRGLFAWHFYNEPMATAGRMLRLMDRICAEPSIRPRFLLWTHVADAPHDDRFRGRFEQIRLSMYPEVPADLAMERLRGVASLGVEPRPMFPVDDGRVTGGPQRLGCACLRPFGEMIFDFYGNLHACCYDWQGEIPIGNIRQPLEELVSAWRKMRRQVASCNPPTRCRRCQGYGLPRFTEAIQRDTVEAITQDGRAP